MRGEGSITCIQFQVLILLASLWDGRPQLLQLNLEPTLFSDPIKCWLTVYCLMQRLWSYRYPWQIVESLDAQVLSQIHRTLVEWCCPRIRLALATLFAIMCLSDLGFLSGNLPALLRRADDIAAEPAEPSLRQLPADLESAAVPQGRRDEPSQEEKWPGSEEKKK